MPTIVFTNTCPNCGGDMLGDGYSTVYHCENLDISDFTDEVDSGPLYCIDQGSQDD